MKGSRCNTYMREHSGLNVPKKALFDQNHRSMLDELNTLCESFDMFPFDTADVYWKHLENHKLAEALVAITMT